MPPPLRDDPPSSLDPSAAVAEGGRRASSTPSVSAWGVCDGSPTPFVGLNPEGPPSPPPVLGGVPLLLLLGMVEGDPDIDGAPVGASVDDAAGDTVLLGVPLLLGGGVAMVGGGDMEAAEVALTVLLGVGDSDGVGVVLGNPVAAAVALAVPLLLGVPLGEGEGVGHTP